MAFGSVIVLVVAFHFVGFWAAASILLAFPCSWIVRGWLENKARYPVRKAIGDEYPDGSKFVGAALCYLGHETRRVSDYALVVDGASLVYVDMSLNSWDIDNALKLASKDNAGSVFAVEQRFHKDDITASAHGLADRHGVAILDLNDVFDAVYDKIRTGGSIRQHGGFGVFPKSLHGLRKQ